MLKRWFFALGLRLLKANISVLRLQKGDVLVLYSLRHNEILTDMTRWDRYYPTFQFPQVSLIGLDPRDSFTKLSDDDLRHAGLVRQRQTNCAKPWTEQLTKDRRHSDDE